MYWLDHDRLIQALKRNYGKSRDDVRIVIEHYVNPEWYEKYLHDKIFNGKKLNKQFQEELKSIWQEQCASAVYAYYQTIVDQVKVNNIGEKPIIGEFCSLSGNAFKLREDRETSYHGDCGFYLHYISEEDQLPWETNLDELEDHPVYGPILEKAKQAFENHLNPDQYWNLNLMEWCNL